MALIKCPKCGKEMSDRADRCPQCGTPIDEIKTALEKIETNAPAATATSQPKKKNGMPTWAWILIIAGSLIIVGGIVFLCLPGKSTPPNTIQENQEVHAIEADVAPISYPDITAQGVEPFLLGSSMFDIPVKGSFYDTLLFEKHYSAFAYSTSYDDLSEKEVKEFKEMWGDEFEVLECVSVANVVKDNDTLMTINCNEKGTITSIEVLSNKIQLVNGVHVGLSATEMFNTYKACYISPGLGSLDNFGVGKQQFYIPDLPKEIYIMASISKEPAALESKGSEVNIKDRLYFSIPLEEVKNDSVRSIIINKNMVISCMDGMEM